MPTPKRPPITRERARFDTSQDDSSDRGSTTSNPGALMRNRLNFATPPGSPWSRIVQSFWNAVVPGSAPSESALTCTEPGERLTPSATRENFGNPWDRDHDRQGEGGRGGGGGVGMMWSDSQGSRSGNGMNMGMDMGTGISEERRRRKSRDENFWDGTGGMDEEAAFNAKLNRAAGGGGGGKTSKKARTRPIARDFARGGGDEGIDAEAGITAKNRRRARQGSGETGTINDDRVPPKSLESEISEKHGDLLISGSPQTVKFSSISRRGFFPRPFSRQNSTEDPTKSSGGGGGGSWITRGSRAMCPSQSLGTRTTAEGDSTDEDFSDQEVDLVVVENDFARIWEEVAMSSPEVDCDCDCGSQMIHTPPNSPYLQTPSPSPFIPKADITPIEEKTVDNVEVLKGTDVEKQASQMTSSTTASSGLLPSLSANSNSNPNPNGGLSPLPQVRPGRPRRRSSVFSYKQNQHQQEQQNPSSPPPKRCPKCHHLPHHPFEPPTNHQPRLSSSLSDSPNDAKSGGMDSFNLHGHSLTTGRSMNGGGSNAGMVNRIARNGFVRLLTERICPAVMHFFHSDFVDPAKERAFRKEEWFLAKPTALATSLFFLIIWALTAGFFSRPIAVFNGWAYIGLCGAFIIPLFPFVALDLPKKKPWLWQLALFLATWCFPWVQVFDMWSCGFYTANPTCGEKDFIGIFYFNTGFPVLALLALRQRRSLATLGALAYIILISTLIIPTKHKWARNLINFILFQMAVVWSSFLKEKGERRMYSLREQLKAQYRATQKAQVAERQASDSKKRFVSYIFHEVRVPLNTALLAMQNMQGEGVFKAIPNEQEEMVTGLSSSLIMMEKVLNDVLDFNRMETGRLISTSNPFNFHQTIRSVVLAFRWAANSRGLQLKTDLDPSIDYLGSTLMGDETRLHQILSNLCSNACKFTQTGSITISTKLLFPSVLPTAPQLAFSQDEKGQRRRSFNSELKHDKKHAGSNLALIRIEIQDTGIGIRARDIKDNRLFSPYVQTEIGRRQGGKGTGLGLALVRQIVRLSGGRLGVTSRYGKGSSFWIEMPFGRPPPRSADMARDRSDASGGRRKPSTTQGGGSSVGMTNSDSKTDSMGQGEVGQGLERSVTEAGSEDTKVDECEGQVNIESETLHASEIPVIINSDGVALPTIAPLTPPDENGPAKTLNILVVDDDPLTRRLMTRMLTRLSHTVTTAENGLVALRAVLAGDQKFDLVFLDNQMPEMTGVEMAREVRRRGIDIFLCGVTGNALKEDQDEYLEAGADRLLTKPVLERNVRDIIARVRERKATAPPTPDGDMARNLADPMLAAGESDASTGGKTLS